eukprot:tig00021318_g20151.t1
MKARLFGKTVESAELWGVVVLAVAVFISFYITGCAWDRRSAYCPPREAEKLRANIAARARAGDPHAHLILFRSDSRWVFCGEFRPVIVTDRRTLAVAAGVVRFMQTLSPPSSDKRYRLYPSEDELLKILGAWFQNPEDTSILPSALLSIQVVDVQPNSNTATMQVFVTNIWDFLITTFLTGDKYTAERAAILAASKADKNLALGSGNVVKKPFSLLIGQTNRAFAPNQIATDFPITVPVEGHPLKYPIDSYTVDLIIAAYGAASGGTDIDDLFVGVQVDTADNSVFTVNPGDRKLNPVDPDPTSHTLIIPILFDRPGIFLVYPFFVLTAMLLILCVEFLTYFSIVVWKKREVQPPFLAIWSAMIFALPGFRNSQPGNPRIGCLVDWCGFFWTEAGAVICFLGLGLRYILDWPAPANCKPAAPPKPEPAPAPAKVDPNPAGAFIPDPSKDAPYGVQYVSVVSDLNGRLSPVPVGSASNL